MKVLLTASVLSHIAQFHKPLINMLKERGYTVHVAASDNLAEKNGLQVQNVDCFFNIAFHRNPFSPSNMAAYRKLRRIIDAEGYDIIHCNTPAVGVLTRLAARQTRKKHNARVIYTAHGFHFYNGASWKNWALYYPIERFMCRYTDTLVTICGEDYTLAQKRFPVNTHRMHGVGVSTARFFPVSPEEKLQLRQGFGLEAGHQVILCTGELLPNKNQATLIKAAALLSKQYPALRVLLAGNGPEEPRLRALIEQLQLQGTVQMLGYRPNIEAYAQAADIVVSCSFREGLGLNLIEGMMTANPIVASVNRGHKELVENGVNGFLVEPANPAAYAEAIGKILSDAGLHQQMVQAALRKAESYSAQNVVEELKEIYGLL